MPQPTNLDYSLLTPELLLTSLIFLVWVLDLLIPAARKRLLGWVAVVGLAVIIAFVAGLPALLLNLSFGEWGVRGSFAGVLRVDEYTNFFRLLLLGTAIAVVLQSMEYVDRFLPHPGEYYGLVLAGFLGMLFMSGSTELLTAYISLELLSFSSYVLVSYAKTNLKSNEAGLKYIVVGAFSSALLLYGISLVYGTTRTTFFSDIAAAMRGVVPTSPAFGLGLALVTAGLGFKVAAVPFHLWTPDAYEGAPTPITAYLSAASKAAGFALVLRIVVGALAPISDQWGVVFALLALLTMVLGNLVAIWQRNIKRMLAYSSIGQVGYLLLGVAAAAAGGAVAEMATRGILFHLAGYAASTMAAFGGVIALQNLTGGRERIQDFAGLGRRAPLVALVLMLALFSFAGMPLFAGFATKFYLFTAAARAGLLWMVGIAVAMSMVSLYYYLLVVREMYVRPPPGYEAAAALAAGHGDGSAHRHAAEHGRERAGENGPVQPSEHRIPLYRVPVLTELTLSGLALLILWLGIYPAPLIENVLVPASRALFG